MNYPDDIINKIHNINCIEGLKLLPDNCIDSICCDPPYELGFMNKQWDKSGIAYNIEMWKECFRVLKPGGHLLAFGGTRTYHRMACAIEDAGFEIRDQMQWIYGSGFPKSMDIAKAITAKEKYGNTHSSSIRKARMGDDYKPTGQEDWHKGMQFETPSNFAGMNSETELTINAQQWDGWGTTLKPAHEPIVVARKPLSEKTVADNVLKWGTGGINIDECRIEYEEGGNLASNPSLRTHINGGNGGNIIAHEEDRRVVIPNTQGRFPANIIFDEEARELLDGQSNNASRFFYCAKASKKERGEGNNHPTVKPLSLIKYLVTMVTPPNGISCDPFEGSGTHAKACKELGFDYVGFEKEKEYCEIAENRVKNII